MNLNFKHLFGDRLCNIMLSECHKKGIDLLEKVSWCYLPVQKDPLCEERNFPWHCLS